MNEAVRLMLQKYNCATSEDYINALKEIIQEIALLGLWRARFYEHAAFYGGTALRILYGLNRFSEDLDFSLLKPDPNFVLNKYNQAVISELCAFGFDVEITNKVKSQTTQIQSAFIKANTIQQLISIQAPTPLLNNIPKNLSLKIKMEIDINPPPHFMVEAKYILTPIPFSINTYRPPDLFADKLHAVLCRQWNHRVKGRDWYDFIWYVGQNIPFRCKHLEARLRETGHWLKEDPLTLDSVKHLLYEKIEKLNIQQAKHDVQPFIKDKQALDVWSKPFFQEIISRIKSV